MRKALLGLGIIICILPVATHAAVVNINTASASTLDTLPGIGPSKAAAIVDYRATHGLFVRTEDLVNVKGIGPSTYATLKALVTVGEVTAPIVSAPSPAQPQAAASGSYNKQPAVVAEAPKQSEPAHANTAVSAPEVASQLAAPGAALSPEEPPARSGGILQSWWTLGFLGVVVLGGGALLIL